MDYIKGVDRNQVILFPEVIDDYIKNDNPVQFIDAFVDSLNLAEFGFNHAKLGPTGRPPYNLVDLLKLGTSGVIPLCQ